MESAVLAIVNPSVRPSVCHTLALSKILMLQSCGLYWKIAP